MIYIYDKYRHMCMCVCCMTNIDAHVADSNTKTTSKKKGAKPKLIL